MTFEEWYEELFKPSPYGDPVYLKNDMEQAYKAGWNACAGQSENEQEYDYYFRHGEK